MHATTYLNILRIINLMKIPFVICADMESMLNKISSSDNDPTKLFASKINLRRGYSSFTCCTFDTNKGKQNFYRGRNSLKKSCENVKEHSTVIINCEK